MRHLPFLSTYRLAGVCGIALTAGLARAATMPVTVINPGFDDPNQGSYTSNNGSNAAGANIIGWNSNDIEVGPSGAELVTNSPPNHVNLLNNTTMTQVTGQVIAAGDVYTLGFYEGTRTDTTGIETQVVASLVASTSGDVLGSVTIVPANVPVGTMSQFTLTTNGVIPAGDIGQNVEIEFQGGGAAGLNGNAFYFQEGLDSVSLSVTPASAPAPAPASAFGGLLLMGITAVATFARRRRA